MNENQKIKNSDFDINRYNDDNFPSYIYCSMGPSQSWVDYKVTLEELNKFNDEI